MGKKNKLEISYNKILDSLPYYVMLVDSEHHILFANKATRKAFNVNLNEIIGLYCPEVIHGKDHPIDECPLEEAIKRKQYIEKEIYDSERKLWVSTSIYPTGLKTESGKEICLHYAMDITDIKKAEKLIEKQKKKIISKNIALKEIINHILIEKRDIEEKISATLNKLIIPKLKLLNKRSSPSSKRQMKLIQKNIKNLASSFGKKISSKELKLSPREIEVCDMIRNSLKNKNIAKELKLSLKTIETIRKNIRRKFNLQNKKINLQNFLLTL